MHKKHRAHLLYVVVAHYLRLKKVGILIFSATPDVNTIFNPIFSMNPCIPTGIKDTQNLHRSKIHEYGVMNNKKGKQKTGCITHFDITVFYPVGLAYSFFSAKALVPRATFIQKLLATSRITDYFILDSCFITGSIFYLIKWAVLEVPMELFSSTFTKTELRWKDI